MLHSLHIKNFRLFRDLEIEPLSRVNLIAGKNNTGKTALLEALALLFVENQNVINSLPFSFRSNLNNSAATSSKIQQRDLFVDYWLWLHYQKKIHEIVIKAVDDKTCTYITKESNVFQNGMPTEMKFNFIKETEKPEWSEMNSGDFSVFSNGGIVDRTSKGNWNWPRSRHFSTRPTLPIDDADLFNQLVIKRKKQRLISLLKVIEPDLKDLQYLKIVSEPLVYVELNLPELIPITQLGQGFTRLFRFFSEMLLAEAQIALIDEIENGLHYSVLEEVWRGIAEIARKEDIQVFATTHSLECIQAAHKVFKESGPNDFALHRLQKIKGEIQVVTHDQEMIEVASESDLEIR
jgi:AAA15 family ATPase/GTPase